MDNVIAEKHGGETKPDNLALSCMLWNRRKANDIGSIDPDTGDLAPLFNPRTETWEEYFQLDDALIVGLTAEGRTTVEFIQLNAFDRLTERAEFIRVGRYPPQRDTT